MSDYGSSYGIQSPLTQEELYRNRSQSRMTALRYAWIGEKCSPELLPYQANLVEHVQREIAAYQARLDNDEVVQQLTTVIQIEIDRARFVLASYLRTRLAKIQKFATYVTTEPKAQQRLSPAELEFARGYRALMADHFNAAFLKDIPEKYRSLDGRDSMAEPNTNEFVIVRSKVDLGDVTIGSQTIPMPKGAIVAARYSDLLPYLSRNQAELI